MDSGDMEIFRSQSFSFWLGRWNFGCEITIGLGVNTFSICLLKPNHSETESQIERCFQYFAVFQFVDLIFCRAIRE